jgi:hypothetical protein
MESKICKEAAVGIMRHIPLTIPGTLEILRKPGNATSKSIITAAYKIGLFTIYGIKKVKKKKYL